MTNKTFLFVEKLTYKDTSLLKTYFLQEFLFLCKLVSFYRYSINPQTEQNTVNSSLADTPIIWTAAKSPARTNYRRSTETHAITDSR